MRRLLACLPLLFCASVAAQGLKPAPLIILPGTITSPLFAPGSGLPPSGACGGDLGNTFPNCTVVASHLSSPLPIAQGGTGLITVPSAGQMLIGNAGGTGYGLSTFSQDCTITSAGVVTCTKTNNVAFGPLATQASPCTAAQGCTGSTSVPSAGQIAVGNAGGTAYAPVSLSQDCTLTSAGVVTCLKTNNVSFTSAATTAIGTSGATIPLLNGANTQSGALTISSVPLTISGNISATSPTTNGFGLKLPAATYTDTTSTGTVTDEAAHAIGSTTIAASSSTTYTRFSELYIAAPIAGSGATVTTLLGLNVNAAARLGFTTLTSGFSDTGTASINVSNNATTSIGTGTTTSSVTIGGGSNDVVIGSHIQATGSTPSAPTSCGTGSPSVSGTDVAGTITTGTGATACTMAFAATFTSTPKAALCTSNSTSAACSVTALSATSITFGLSAALSGTIYYWVIK